jgi:hypothetical protein
MCQNTIAANFQIPVGSRTIVEVRTYLNYASVKYSPAFTTNTGCPGTVATEYAIIDWSVNADNKNIYNAALAAFLLGKTVGFGINNLDVDGGLYSCHDFGAGTPTIYRLDMD